MKLASSNVLGLAIGERSKGQPHIRLGTFVLRVLYAAGHVIDCAEQILTDFLRALGMPQHIY